MKNTIHYSALAEQDLDGIFAYIAYDLQNPIAAQNTIQGIMATIADLKTLSGIGTKVILPNAIDSGYRFISYKNYLAFYRQEAQDIYIDRVLYNKRDYLSILFG